MATDRSSSDQRPGKAGAAKKQARRDAKRRVRRAERQAGVGTASTEKRDRKHRTRRPAREAKAPSGSNKRSVPAEPERPAVSPEPPAVVQPLPDPVAATADVEARIEFYERTRPHAPYVGVATESGNYVVATHDQHIGRSLFAKQGRPEFRVLGASVAAVEILAGKEAVDERIFIDVGANIGTTTVPALVTHGFGSAVCIEPEEENFRVLRANLALNGLHERSHAVQAGVSNRTGCSELVVVEGAGGKPWIAVDPEKVREAKETRDRLAAEKPDENRPEMSVVEVDLITLDHLVAEGAIDPERLGMLWIDAEGHEGHVIEGASELVTQGVPMVFEFHPEGLDERGDREKIHELAEEHYTHFIDVRRQETDPSQPRFMLRPVSDLARFAERFLDPETAGYFTDLLMVRLDEKQGRRGKQLPELMRSR